MPATTPIYQLPYPVPADPADVPADLQALANRIEAAFTPGTVTGQVPVWDNATKTWKTQAGGTSRIFDSTLGAAAANFDITGIPATFSHLQLFVFVRADPAALTNSCLARFNNDSTANYHSQTVQGQGSTAAAGEGTAATSASLGACLANTAPANWYSSHIVQIPNYAASGPIKIADFLTTYRWQTAAGGHVRVNGGVYWNNGAAISRITVLPQSGNWMAGSRCTLYGLA